MAPLVTTFKDFSGGEYGRTEGWKAAKNTFTATNMTVYRTGEIGVRAGVKNITPSGIIAGAIAHLIVPLGSTRAIFTQGTAVRSFAVLTANDLQVASTALASAATASSPIIRESNLAYLSVLADKTYSITPASPPVVTALSASPGGRGLSRLGDRLIGTSTNQLKYSAAADPTSWPSDNVIVVGDASNITALYTQRTHLLICKESGLFVLTGVPGVNETLRPVSGTPGPSTQSAGDVDTRGLAAYVPSDQAAPAFFDGTNESLLEHLSTLAPSVRVVRTSRDDLIFGNADATSAPATQTMLTRTNGVWSKHSFPILGSTGTRIADYPNSVEGTNNATYVLFGTMDSTPAFYIWPTQQDSPGLESGLHQRAGDASTTQVSGTLRLPQTHSENGTDLQVRTVQVDFRSWNTGGALTNHFDVTVTALRQYDGNDGTASTPLSWDESGSYSSTSGSDRRVVFSFGDQGQGGAYRLDFANIRGISIKEVTVVADQFPVRNG